MDWAKAAGPDEKQLSFGDYVPLILEIWRQFYLRVRNIVMS